MYSLFTFATSFHTHFISTVSFKATALQTAVHALELTKSLFDGTLNVIHHFAFTSTMSSNDVYTYGQMLKQPDRQCLIQAMLDETEAHSSRNHWSIIRRLDVPQEHKPIMSIWAFKRK